MNTTMVRSFAISAFAAFLFSGSAGYACSYIGEPIENITDADVVFIGIATDHQVITPEGEQPDSVNEYALITFNVTETWKGIVKETWLIYEQNPEFNHLQNKYIPDGPLIVSAVFPDNPILSHRKLNPKAIAPKHLDFLVVLEDVCDSYIFNTLPNTLAGVKNELESSQIYEGDIPKNCYIARWRSIEGRLEMERIPTPCSED